MQRLRRLLESSTGKFVAVGASVVLIALAGYVVVQSIRGDTPDSARHTMFICTETGKPFEHQNKIGETQPILSPHSGKNTGVPAEACYWNADGSTKTTPTWVLLDELAGKPGPTFCPDCNRLVVGHNPQPVPGANPPPTKEQYVPRRKPAPSREEDR